MGDYAPTPARAFPALTLRAGRVLSCPVCSLQVPHASTKGLLGDFCPRCLLQVLQSLGAPLLVEHPVAERVLPTPEEVVAAIDQLDPNPLTPAGGTIAPGHAGGIRRGVVIRKPDPVDDGRSDLPSVDSEATTRRVRVQGCRKDDPCPPGPCPGPAGCP